VSDVLVHDDGTDFEGGDTEWNGSSFCSCSACGHDATVAEFRTDLGAAMRRGLAQGVMNSRPESVVIQDAPPVVGQDEMYVKAWVQVSRELPNLFVTPDGCRFEPLLDKGCWRRLDGVIADFEFDRYGRPIGENSKSMKGEFFF